MLESLYTKVLESDIALGIVLKGWVCAWCTVIGGCVVATEGTPTVRVGQRARFA